MDRERGALERQEKKLIADIKKMAKTGQMDAVKIMAKGELVDHATLHTKYPTAMQDPRGVPVSTICGYARTCVVRL